MLQSGECPDDQFRRVVNGFAAIRYEPAIPYLVGNIDFVPAGTSDAFFGLDSVPEMFPCVGALLAYGDSAVGPLIDAYLQEPNKVRRGLLALPISGDKMERLAFFYARGILTSKQTRIKVHPEAADDLMQWLSQRNWQHFEFTPDI